MKAWAHSFKQQGFTIVELLIVIVVIAILAAISIVSYNGITTRANETRTNSDLTQLQKAISAGRIATNKNLWQIINNGNHTSTSCTNALTPGTDVKTLDKSTSSCWNNYRAALTAIEQASGANLSNLKEGDYRGIPYYIDQNEGESVANTCVKDIIGTIVNPLPATMSPSYIWMENRRNLDLVGATC